MKEQKEQKDKELVISFLNLYFIYLFLQLLKKEEAAKSAEQKKIQMENSKIQKEKTLAAIKLITSNCNFFSRISQYLNFSSKNSH